MQRKLSSYLHPFSMAPAPLAGPTISIAQELPDDQDKELNLASKVPWSHHDQRPWVVLNIMIHGPIVGLWCGRAHSPDETTYAINERYCH